MTKKELKEKYIKLCEEYGFKPFPTDKDNDVIDVIQQTWSLVNDFHRDLVHLMALRK